MEFDLFNFKILAITIKFKIENLTKKIDSVKRSEFITQDGKPCEFIKLYFNFQKSHFKIDGVHRFAHDH